MAKSRSSSTGRPASSDSLAEYRAKRDFTATPEPAPSAVDTSALRSSFVVQKHDATRLHYDIRLEIDGAMMSFAVPKGPSYDPDTKRFAVETEDHPLAYNEFEGRIPDGNYGAGDVLIWDAGTYETVPPGNATAMRKKGHLHVRFFGEKLAGEWHFVKMKRDRTGGAIEKQWLFFKAKDGHASKTRDVVNEQAASIVSGRSATRGPMRVTSSHTTRALLELVGEPMQAMNAVLDDPSQYTFEVKFDGYRILAAKSGSDVRLESRRGHDWTARFQPIADAIAKLPVRDAVFDGEVCAVTSDGRPSFQRLQQWVGGERREVAIAFALFDLAWLDGRDLRKLPIEERRELLRPLIGAGGSVLSFSASVAAPIDGYGRPDVSSLIDLARRAGLEGFVAKRRGSPYVSGKCPQWVKLKCIRRQELAVAGYTPLSGSKANVVGGLILAVCDEHGKLRYAGKVGSGLDDAQRKQLAALLERDRIDAPPILLDEKIKDARWSTPKLVAEVSFLEWSDDGKLRHPTFVAMREDKAPFDCVREDERPPPPAPPSRVKLTNPDKVLFPRDGIRKRDIVELYEALAPVMLPHLSGRPLTLQRWPDGIDEEAWYQHRRGAGAEYLRRYMLEGKEHIVCDDVDGLRQLANLAALTLHSWSAHIGKNARTQEEIERDLLFPDYAIIDLDPGSGPWSHVVDVALAARVLLDRLELPSFVKTTGKRGLHICVPIARGPSHAEATRLAEHIATAIARVLPEIATVERAIPKRNGRLYIDYLQNGHGKTIAAPYTLRALDGAPVSTPIRWSEVGPSLDPKAFNLRTVRARVDAHGDLFAGVLRGGPEIRPLLARLG
jgi:bifunctional non-homologous end joining protein LigD